MKRPSAVRSFCRSSSKYSASCAEPAAYVLGCRRKALQRSSPLCMAAARDLLHSAANQTRIFDAQTVIARMLCICITLRAMTCSVCGKCSTLPCTRNGTPFSCVHISAASGAAERELALRGRISRASKAGKRRRNSSDSKAGQKIPPVFAAASR